MKKTTEKAVSSKPTEKEVAQAPEPAPPEVDSSTGASPQRLSAARIGLEANPGRLFESCVGSVLGGLLPKGCKATPGTDDQEKAYMEWAVQTSVSAGFAAVEEAQRQVHVRTGTKPK